MSRTIITLAAITAASIFGSTANAAHSSFCYTGQRCGFDGEVHLIEALVMMEDAYNSPCHITRRRLVSRARLEVLSAMRVACDRTARYEMLDAYRNLTRFVITNDACYLDAAATSITTAIELSQLAYLPPADPVIHNHRNPHVHTPAVHTTRRVITQYPSNPYRYPTNSIRIGNPRSGFSFRIGF